MSWLRQWVFDHPYRLILFAIFALGCGFIALSPPFEGFDETAHWSSLARWGLDGRMPIYGQDRLDQAIYDYSGPLPYSSALPFDVNGGQTYHDFAPSQNVGPHHQTPPQNTQPTAHLNWQAQHPPLYYLILQPVFQLTKSWSWADHFLALRMMSWILAFSGLVIGVEFTRWAWPNLNQGQVMVLAAWPLLVPQFIPEMARLGNDSLCLLCFALAWAALLKLEENKRPLRWAIVLGLALGAGLWTKAFFIPISAGLTVYIALRAWQTGGRYWLTYGVLALGLAGLIGVGWYLYKWTAYGNIIGGDEMLQFDKDGGVFLNFLREVTPFALVRGYSAIAASFVWAGSWSLARPAEWMLIGPCVLVAGLGLRWAWRLRLQRLKDALPLFVLVPMLGGLSYHMMLRIALTGEGVGIPGWYLHILAPALALILALAWPQKGWQRWGVWSLSAYTLVFTAWAWLQLLALYSGCAIKQAETKHIVWPQGACLIDLAQMQSLAYPFMGFGFLALACFFSGLGAYMLKRQAAA
ncbi:hypothetical protein [Woodsholea maritima]|uniref:hypothetical protein n=1 Tax=Woodsholea maritima TaxID=240237 RepID=UPI00037556FC|nr:hypothetical protein [Woodsholea maritima]